MATDPVRLGADLRREPTPDEIEAGRLDGIPPGPRPSTPAWQVAQRRMVEAAVDASAAHLRFERALALYLRERAAAEGR